MSFLINNFMGISDMWGKLCFVGQDCYKILRQCPNLSKYFLARSPFDFRNKEIDYLQKKYSLKGNAIEMVSGFIYDTPAASFSSYFETRKVIQYDLRVSVIDPEAMSWILKHEFSHIKNNDCPKVDALQAIIDIAALCFFPSALQLASMSVAKSFLARTYTKSKEASADDFAIQEGSVEELKGGIRWIEAEMLAETQYYKEHPILAPVAKVTQWLFDSHPSLKSRQEKIEKALIKRDPKTDLQAIKTNKKVEQLAKIFRFNSDNSIEALLAGTFGFRYEKFWEKTDEAYCKVLHPS